MKNNLHQVVDIAIEAGREILEVYAGEFEVDIKADGSPLTQADRRADQLIRKRLRQLDPAIPILSEESGSTAFAQRCEWSRFWLVDPLDGTKGFVKRNNEFTVNIALVEGNDAILGVVHAPVSGISYYAAAGMGAFKVCLAQKPVAIRVKKFKREKVLMLASRHHAGAAVEAYRARLAEHARQVETAILGSALKICLVAEGLADIYPRLGPTSEWDTAAAHCVLEAAGGSVTSLTGAPLQYNKENLLNPWFLAGGDPEFDWSALADGLQSSSR